MGKVSRAKRSQRARRQEERRIQIIKDRLRSRIDQSLRETLSVSGIAEFVTICLQHNFEMRSEEFMEGQKEVREVVACSDERMELEMSDYFPAEGMTLTVIGRFMDWLFTPRGEPIQPVCLPWCRKLGELVVKCDHCRGGAPMELSRNGEQNQRLVRMQKAKAVVDLILSGEESTDPMLVDPDVVAASSGRRSA